MNGQCKGMLAQAHRVEGISIVCDILHGLSYTSAH